MRDAGYEIAKVWSCPGFLNRQVNSAGKSENEERIILHIDCNCFYASVEMLHHPELAGRPLAVGGDPEARHGIVLTANYPAKRRGVRTGMALWQARQACPNLYIRFSRMARRIYRDYSDQVESFGLDECWVDITDCCRLFGDHTRTLANGRRIAEEISGRVKRELGITVSIGVSWNKIYAKLGSDYKKPDAITVFDRSNYKRLIYSLPVSDLLYVGSRTKRKLQNCGIRTIGELANADPLLLHEWLGKIGLMLSMFARGLDETPVSEYGEATPIKSIGNSTTTPRDLVNPEDVKLVLYLLSESVAKRLRENGLEGQVVEVYVRDNGLSCFHQQRKLRAPTCISAEIEAAAAGLFTELYRWEKPIRSIGIRVAALRPEGEPRQMDLFVDEARREKLLLADFMTDEIRRRFGFYAVQRGIMYRDPYLSSLDAAADDHMIQNSGALPSVCRCLEVLHWHG